MNWFFIALIGPIFWSIGNHVDKTLLDGRVQGLTIRSLMVVSSIIGVFVLPFILFFKPYVFNIPITNIFILIIVGFLSASAIWLYFNALEHDEASVVVPFYQLIPVFGYIFGYIFLGEILRIDQIIAMILIIIGALIISIEIDSENKFKIKKRTPILMVFSALLFSLDSVLFKFAAINEDFWISTFWEYFGLGLVGIILLTLCSRFRKETFEMIKVNKFNIFFVNILNETLTIFGNIATAFSYLLAPVSLVLLVNSYQPIFVFIIGIFMTIFFPKYLSEKITIKHIVPKILSILIMAVGTYLLFI